MTRKKIKQPKHQTTSTDRVRKCRDRLKNKQQQINANKAAKIQSKYRNLKQILEKCAAQTDTILTDKEKETVICDFENQMKQTHHHYCNMCKCVSLMMDMSKKENICKECSSKSENYYIENNLLPIWYDEYGKIQYFIPDELNELTDAEKMLIQRVSPFIPLHHIKNGTMGIKGHVCSFPQDISSICNTLPRLPSDVTIVKMIHSYLPEIGGEPCQKVFTVRKYKVISALKWLKNHHKGYKDITISDENLDWMGNADEKELPVNEYTNTSNVQEDLGPARKQYEQKLQEAGGITQVSGMVNINESPICSEDDEKICKFLDETAKNHGMLDAIKWPKISSEPVNEYSFKCNIFSLAFPWLFPGGIGDYCDERKKMFLYMNGAKNWSIILMVDLLLTKCLAFLL